MKNIEEIYTEYFEVVYKYLICLTHNSDLAEDLAQETFYKAILKINTFKEECKISTWLCKIAKNLWLDELKKKKMINIDDEFNFIISDEYIEDKIISNEEKKELYSKINKLDLNTRKVMYLRINGNLSFKEIADILDKSENWARVTYYRGKSKMKEGEFYE